MKGVEKLIENESERLAAVKEIERLWDSKPGTPEADRLKLLAKLVELYEKEKFPFPPPDPVTAILFRLEQAGLTRKDLEPILGGRNRVSEVLNGSRSLSKGMIRKLHQMLGIPLESLVQEPERPVERRRPAGAIATLKTTAKRKVPGHGRGKASSKA